MFQETYNVLNTVLSIVVDPQKSAQLDFCAKEVFNQVGERSPILKNMKLTEDRTCWQWTKRQGGYIPKCMAQAMVMLPSF